MCLVLPSLMRRFVRLSQAHQGLTNNIYRYGSGHVGGYSGAVQSRSEKNTALKPPAGQHRYSDSAADYSARFYTCLLWCESLAMKAMAR